MPEDEYNMFDWDAFKNDDPSIMVKICASIAQKTVTK